MRCENNFCIYESNGKCMLNKISIDGLGMCAECIYPTIDEQILADAKQQLLKTYEKEDS